MADSNPGEQYKTAENLNIRISIHQKYSVNRQGFGNWIFSTYQIGEGMKVLELGRYSSLMYLVALSFKTAMASSSEWSPAK